MEVKEILQDLSTALKSDTNIKRLKPIMDCVNKIKDLRNRQNKLFDQLIVSMIAKAIQESGLKDGEKRQLTNFLNEPDYLHIYERCITHRRIYRSNFRPSREAQEFLKTLLFEDKPEEAEDGCSST
jgi:hypothetical protein